MSGSFLIKRCLRSIVYPFAYFFRRFREKREMRVAIARERARRGIAFFAGEENMGLDGLEKQDGSEKESRERVA